MNHLNQKQKLLCAVMLVLLAALAPVFLWSASLISAQEQTENQITIQFSQKSGFYQDTVQLTLISPEKGQIRYTLDGSEPTPDNEEAILYDETYGIIIPCSEKEKVYNVKAALVADNGMESGTFAETYIVGRNVEERYDMPVLSIFGDPAGLTGENGILQKENRDFRGREWEREIRITLFDMQGGTMLKQACGVRMFGDGTRQKNQPSMKLFARSEYDEQNEFDCLLFQDYSENNALITGCKRVVIRSGGNDNGYAHIRSEFASKLCQDAGFPDAQASSPVCVYVNGEYYGTYWLTETFDDSYFEKKYGEFDGQMVLLEDNIGYSEPQETDDELTLQFKEEYNNLYPVLSSIDLNDPDNWNYLNETIDVENFLQYMAMENYFGNKDAMFNNYKTYRYYSPDGSYLEGTVFDGRYRFLLFDMDQTLGYGVYDEPGAEAEILNTTNRVNYDIFYNSLFANIVKTQEGRDIYTRYYLALLNYYCADERAEAILDEMHESRDKELRRQYAETELMVDNKDTPADIDYSHVLQHMKLIRKFLQNRPDWALYDLEEAFGLSSRYTLSVQNPGEAYLSVDAASFSDAAFEGTYYSEIPVLLTAQPKCGDKFDHWLVDGIEYYEPSLLITGEMIQDETLFVECVTSPDPDAGLLVTAIRSRGGNDYVELTNFGAAELDLSTYTLGDNADRERASTLPSLLVAPGDTIRIYCKNHTGAEAIGQPQVNFNIKAGEDVYLYRKRLIQKVYVPKLGTKTGVYRMDTHSGIFYERLD